MDTVSYLDNFKDVGTDVLKLSLNLSLVSLDKGQFFGLTLQESRGVKIRILLKLSI